VGLFELQRELHAESARKQKTAKTKARALDASTLIDDAWAMDLDPKVIEPMYRKVAAKDDAVGLAVARLDKSRPESNRALFEENIEIIAPVLAARLRTDRAIYAAQLLAQAGPRAARAVPALRAAAETVKDKDTQRWCAWAIARIGSEEHLPFVAKIAGEKPPWVLTEALVRRGVSASVTRAIDTVRQWLEARAKKEAEREGIGELMEALGEARSEEALPILHDALGTPLSRHALAAIAKIAHASSYKPVEEHLALIAGDPEENWAYRLPAEDALRAVAPRAAWPPLDTAREVLQYIHPRRYAWPKVEEIAIWIALAARALRLQGEAADLETVARLANAPFWAVRAEAAIAYEKVHGEKPKLVFWDEVRTARALKTMKPKALLDVVRDSSTIFRHNVVRALAKTKDPKTQLGLADVARAELEGRPNHPVDYYEESDMGADAHAMLLALETLARKPPIKKRLAKTTSLWIQKEILGREINPSEWHRGPPEPVPPLLASVKKIGGRSQGSFAVGRHTNALAYSNDGTKLVAVGDSLGVILDSDSGATVCELELRYNWGYGAIFSNDDKELWVCYHGGHLELFDAETGKTKRSLEGHGGVPNGIRGIAMSPDGTRLLTAGSDGRAILWSLPSGKVVKKWTVEKGAFHGTAFSPDGKRFAVSRLRDDKAKKGDAVFVGDPKTGKATTFETPTSMWALAFAKNGTLVMAGEGKHIFFSNERGKTSRKLVQSDVVQMVFSRDDKTLVAISETGVANAWDVASGKPKKLGTGDGPLWALAQNKKTGAIAMAGTAGIVHRFDAKLTKIGGDAALTMHTGQARGFAVMKDGRYFTCGWDGRLLLWSPSGTRLVHQLDERMTEVQLTSDDAHVLVLHSSGLLCFDTQTLAITGRYAPKIKNDSIMNPESLAIQGDLAAVGHWGGSVRTFAIPTLEPQGVVQLGKPEIEVMLAHDGGFLCGTDDGRIVSLSASLETRWTLAGFGREAEDDDRPQSVTALAVHDKMLAAGHWPRLFDLSGSTPLVKKRFVTSSGLFNNLVFSPSGARLVVPTSYSFEVYDAHMGTLLAKLDRREFPGCDELTRAAALSEDDYLVGAENGTLFQVTLK
jgi:WD40 repeat protein